MLSSKHRCCHAARRSSWEPQGLEQRGDTSYLGARWSTLRAAHGHREGPLIKRTGRETLSQVTPQEPWVQASEEKRGVKCHPRLSQHHRLTAKVKASQTKPALIYRLRLTLPLTAFYTVCMSRVVSFTEHLLWATRWGILPVGGDGV